MNIRETVKAQRAYFQSGATLSREARCTALLKLKEGIKRHEEEITEALHSDLGKSPTEAYMTEIASLYSDIDHAIRHNDVSTHACFLNSAPPSVYDECIITNAR